MIRPNKPVKLLEWGEGTVTLNQVWNEIGQGTIASVREKDGLTTLTIVMTGEFKKQNAKDDSIKVTQLGEGLTARSQSWGEVAIGKLRATDSGRGRTIVCIEVETATKVGKGRDV